MADELPEIDEKTKQELFIQSSGETKENDISYELYKFHSEIQDGIFNVMTSESGRSLYLSDNKTLILFLIHELKGGNYFRSNAAAETLSILNLEENELLKLGFFLKISLVATT